MTSTPITTTGTLPVPGATLYYEVRGTGPLLLISQSGEGDAGRSTDLVDRLVTDYTVVTYDRRGLSRSTLSDPARPITMPDHADDVHHLLAALTDKIASALGIDPTNQHAEPDLTPQPMTPQRIANFDAFIRHDFTAIVRDALNKADIAALTDVRIIPAAGRTTPRTVFDYRCAQQLAVLLDTDLTEFPGGHNGNTTHPTAYTTQLRHALHMPATGRRYPHRYDAADRRRRSG